MAIPRGPAGLHGGRRGYCYQLDADTLAPRHTLHRRLLPHSRLIDANYIMASPTRALGNSIIDRARCGSEAVPLQIHPDTPTEDRLTLDGRPTKGAGLALSLRPPTTSHY